jgi:hypothetical protein
MTEPPDDSNVVRLGREERTAIARGLRDWYQHVVDEGIPEHLKKGLARLLSSERLQSRSTDTAARPAGPGGGADLTEEPEGDPPPERPDRS